MRARSFAIVFCLGCALNGPAHVLRPTVSLDEAPPFVRGGTLAANDAASEVLVVDRDRALVHEIAIADHSVHTWTFDPGARADRAIYADGDRVALLADGSLVRLDEAATPIAQSCADPRGLAWDSARGRVWVSCADGELVGISWTSPSDVVRYRLPADLGDIVVRGNELWIARVRAAQVLHVSALDGSITSQISLRSTMTEASNGTTREDTPQGILRMVDGGALGVLVLHERMRVGPPPGAAYYGPSADVPGPCGTPAVSVAISRVDADATNGPTLSAVSYASDFAYDAQTGELRVASPVVNITTDSPSANVVGILASATDCEPSAPHGVPGQAVAIAAAGTHWIVQTREPATLVIDGGAIALPGASVRDTGHDLFYTAQTADDVPCASCHLDGGTDGHVWDLGSGLRCTMTLRGGLSATAPFHWNGSLPDLESIFALHVPTVMATTPPMTVLSDADVAAFAHWIDRQPADTHPDRDAALVARGAAVYDLEGCGNCHGAGGTAPDARNFAIGGGEWQVPALVDLDYRAPLTQDGCAASFDALLSGACGLEMHDVSSADDRAALAAYLGAP